ncbi:MAG: hypothetical protein NT069_14425 [Planctomycetota bacterium]|nr:hypothetical protein [Planctomycetota bacterium]
MSQPLGGDLFTIHVDAVTSFLEVNLKPIGYTLHDGTPTTLGGVTPKIRRQAAG